MQECGNYNRNNQYIINANFLSHIIVVEEVVIEILYLISANNTIYSLRRVCIITVYIFGMFSGPKGMTLKYFSDFPGHNF